MSSEKWMKYKLGEIFDISSGLSKGGEEFGHGYPFLTFKDVFQNYFLPEKLESLANATQQEIIKCSIRKGDVFFTRTSETQEDLGMSSVALKDYENATFNGFTKRLRLKEGVDLEIYPEYIAYYFRNQKFRQQISSVSTLTTRASLNNSMIEVLDLELPSLKVQKAIGNILKALDDKIELNRRMNETLEGIAQAIWGEWFGKYVGGEEELPEGWTIGKLEQVVEFKNGKTSPKRNESGLYNVYGSNGIIGNTDSFNSEKDTIIIGRVGSYCGSLYLSKEPCWVTDNAIIGKGKIPSTDLYVFLLLKTIDLNSLKSGSGQPLINQSILGDIEVIHPTVEMMQKFDNFAQSSFVSIEKNKNQSLTLTALRDSLLPRLMRGEIYI